MKEYTVYGLQCPLTNEIRWIGRTKQPELRYRSHCNGLESVNKHGLASDNILKVSWIRGLRDKNKKPLLVIFKGNLTFEQATLLETSHIEKYRNTIFNKHLGTLTPTKRGTGKPNSISDGVKYFGFDKNTMRYNPCK